MMIKLIQEVTNGATFVTKREKIVVPQGSPIGLMFVSPGVNYVEVRTNNGDVRIYTRQEEA